MYKSRPRILFIQHLPPPVHGAAMMGLFIKNSQAINEDFSTDYINLSTSNNLTDIGKTAIMKLVAMLRLLAKVFVALTIRKYDLCYMTLTASGPGFYKDVFVVAVLRIFRKSIIYHFHNKGVKLRQHRWADDVLYKFVFRGSRCILLSKCLYADVQKYVKPTEVFYCPNGIPEIDDVVPRESLTSSPRLLFLSNMIKQKGVYVLLEACALLKKRAISFECHLVGAWSDITESDLKGEIERLDIRSVVYAHGKKYNEDKSAFFKTSDIFVFPTFYHNECFPLVLLEAMQYGLPIISTPEGGIQDIVVEGKTGFLVEQRNAIALANRIEELLTNHQLRRKMGANARLRYEECFTIRRFEHNLCSILKGLVTRQLN